MQVREAVSLVAVAPLPTVAVTVAAPIVGPRHVATPLVASLALLIEIWSVSETVHVGVSLAITSGVAQPAPAAAGRLVAVYCCWFPGAAAVWSAVAVAGETASTGGPGPQAGFCEPQPARRPEKLRASIHRFMAAV